MKLGTKIISVALILVMALSVMIIPASAATPAIKADVVATKAGQYNSLDYYKVSVYIDSTHSLTGYQVNVSWDSSVFQMMKNTGAATTNAFSVKNCLIEDEENVTLDVFSEYATYGGGSFEADYLNASYGYALMPGDQSSGASFAKMSATNLGTLSTTNTGVYSAWAIDYTDNYLTISGGAVRDPSYVSPTDGRQMVLSFYLQVKAGVADGDYEIGFLDGQAAKLTGTYSVHDEVDGIICSGVANTASIQESMVTYTNATVTVGAAGPAVAKSKAQVKMTPNSATTVEDAFSFRVTSVITDADWDTYFANSADASATTNAIKSVGFVAYKGTTGFNLDTAKAVAQGTPAAGYEVATTDYIQKVDDASDAYFGCRLDITSAATRSDVTYVAFVQYVDGTGAPAYAFYEAEQTALLNTNYGTIVSNYLAAYPFAG